MGLEWAESRIFPALHYRLNQLEDEANAIRYHRIIRDMFGDDSEETNECLRT